VTPVGQQTDHRPSNILIIAAVLWQPMQSLECLVFVALASEIFDSLNAGRCGQSRVKSLLQPGLTLRHPRTLLTENQLMVELFVILLHGDSALFDPGNA
jgi:hypothetical protein